MKIDELRPHIQSRLSHELGLGFIDALPITIVNRLLEKDAYISSFHSDEIAKQASPKIEPDILMDALLEVAHDSNHMAAIKDTNPKGHLFVQMVTNSCHLIIMRRSSKNTSNAQYYASNAILNAGLERRNQGDLLDAILHKNEIPLDNLLFVCASAYWDEKSQFLDIEFVLPHPNESHPIMTFTLDELRLSATQPMTDIAEEPIIVLKSRLDQADDESSTG